MDKWAYFFRETFHLKAVPPALAEGPFARALDVARSQGFTAEEWEQYDRAGIALQDARGALSFERKEGRAEGRVEGLRQGTVRAVEAVCELLGIDRDESRRSELAALDEAGLGLLLDRLKRQRQW